MLLLLSSLFEKCAVTVEIADGKLRFSAKGLIGIIGMVLVIFLIVHYMPQLVGLVSAR